MDQDAGWMVASTSYSWPGEPPVSCLYPGYGVTADLIPAYRAGFPAEIPVVKFLANLLASTYPARPRYIHVPKKNSIVGKVPGWFIGLRAYLKTKGLWLLLADDRKTVSLYAATGREIGRYFHDSKIYSPAGKADRIHVRCRLP